MGKNAMTEFFSCGKLLVQIISELNGHLYCDLKPYNTMKSTF